jgi:hypothetical protein
MINVKQVQKAIRDVASGTKKSVELKDPGRRGAGRLALAVRPMTERRIAAEWYAVYYRTERRVKMKLGSYPAMTIAEARSAFFTVCAPVIASGADPAVKRKTDRGNGTVASLFEAYVANLEAAKKFSAGTVRRALLGPKQSRGCRGRGQGHRRLPARADSAHLEMYPA